MVRNKETRGVNYLRFQTTSVFSGNRPGPLNQLLSHSIGNQASRMQARQNSGSTKDTTFQSKCDIMDVLNYYNKTKNGKKIHWTIGLIDKLYKILGVTYKPLYDSAIKEGKIGVNFIALVCNSQETLGLSGIEIDGKIGPKFIAAWRKWKTGGKKGIDYTRLLKDKRLEIGIGIGEDYINFGYKDLKLFFRTEGFKAVITSQHETYTKTMHLPVQGNRIASPVPIEIVIELINEVSVDPIQTFEQFLTEKEILIYSGHARYGTGPDFDAKSSPSENFMIGVNSALHKAGKLKKGYNAEMNKIIKGKVNDLERLSKAGKFDPDLYQVWFFDTCSAINYLDGIRGGLVADKKGAAKSRTNLRFFGTKTLVYPDPLTLLKSILEMKSMEEIIAIMEKNQEAEVAGRGETTKKGGYYFAD